MSAINYKNFTLNSSGDTAPWSDLEVQFHKDIINTVVGDAVTVGMDTAGHKHKTIYDEFGSARVLGQQYGASIETGFSNNKLWLTGDSGGDITITPNKDLYFNASNGWIMGVKEEKSIDVYLGDTTGSKKITVYDSGTNLKASIDSAGNGYFAGSLGKTAWKDWSASCVVTGWDTGVTKRVEYTQSNKTIIISVDISGTSTGTGATFTVPVAPKDRTKSREFVVSGCDNSSSLTAWGMAQMEQYGTTVNVFKTPAAGAWTSSGTKNIHVTLVYEVE
jgi:hypothetical protein